MERLRREDWFRNVGMRDTQAADILGSWKEAVESCGSLDWENLCQEAVNQYSARIIERSPREYERWNDVVMAVKPASEALVREKVRSVVADHNLPKAFVDAVKWDILHVFLEAEFADVYPPGFYASQAYWYTKGHFPCGWRGVFPEGRLVVY